MRQDIEAITRKAGQILMSYFKNPQLKITIKDDQSPVTEADFASSDHFQKELARFGCPVVTEESQPGAIPQGDYFLIDPLDGTRYFIDGVSHFAILVALISDRRPVLGVTYFPAMNLLFSAEKGKGAFLNGDRILNQQRRKDLVAFSLGFHRRPEAAPIIESLNIKDIREQESVLKLGYMGRGDVDIYPRFGRTYEWDTGSGQILLEEAGCQMFDVNTLEPLQYSKPDYLNRGFVAFRADLEPQVKKVFHNLNWRLPQKGHRDAE